MPLSKNFFWASYQTPSRCLTANVIIPHVPLPQTLEHVCLNHEPVIVRRKHLQPVVVMSLEDYQALTETAYLLRSPNNARRLFESIEELERGGGEERELLDR